VIPRDAQRFLAVGSGEYFVAQASNTPRARCRTDGSSSTTSRVPYRVAAAPYWQSSRDGERLIDAWKADVESGAFANSAAEIDMSAGLFNDGPAGDEAEAGALPLGLVVKNALNNWL